MAKVVAKQLKRKVVAKGGSGHGEHHGSGHGGQDLRSFIEHEKQHGKSTVSIAEVIRRLPATGHAEPHGTHGKSEQSQNGAQLLEQIRSLVERQQTKAVSPEACITIRGECYDIADTPFEIDIMGINIRFGPSHHGSGAGEGEHHTGKQHAPKALEYDIEVVGPDRGDVKAGTPPGRLFINGKEISYDYRESNGVISSHAMFSTHRSLKDFARALISAVPDLDTSGHHH